MKDYWDVGATGLLAVMVAITSLFEVDYLKS
jgi:hypothetical protein